jgi:hypothetical protein
MAAIRIIRPRRPWSVSPATVLPTALLLRLFKRHWSYTVVLDHRAAGTIGVDQEKVFDVDPGEHVLHMRFVLLRRSKEMRVSLKEGEERVFLCGTSGLGWPTLREASPQDVAEIRGASVSEPPDSEPPDSEAPEPDHPVW